MGASSVGMGWACAHMCVYERGGGLVVGAGAVAAVWLWEEGPERGRGMLVEMGIRTARGGERER